MREIKFRAWVTDGKSYSEMYPNVQNHIGSDFGFGHILQNTVKGLDCKVMQYTGLRDKNGVEIYEGDIIEDHIGRGVVVWWVRNAAFKVSYIGENYNKGKWLVDYLESEYKTITVIGNIYENPELLESL